MKTKVILAIISALSLFFGISTTSYAVNELSYVNFGLIGAYGIDNPGVNAAANQKPALIGGEFEVGFKDTPISYRMQLGVAQVGTNLSASYYTASYFNLFIQYNFNKLGILYPYIGLGYSDINITPATPYSGGTLGWIIGANYPISPAFTVGAFYNGSNPPNTAFIYNHFVGIDFSYKFNL